MCLMSRLLTRWIVTRSVSSVSAAPEWRHYPCLFAAPSRHSRGIQGWGGAIKIWIKNKVSDRTNIKPVTQCVICLLVWILVNNIIFANRKALISCYIALIAILPPHKRLLSKMLSAATKEAITGDCYALICVKVKCRILNCQ